jgi:phospholipid/cholesterol/gamma-HCH transport system substrate-binding protein
MNDQKIRFRVGAFILAMLVLLGVLSTQFSNFANYLKSYNTYTIVFDEAPGVGPGTPVRRSGIPIGEVRSVELNDQTGKVQVVIRVEKQHPLAEGDQPTLARGLLGNDPTIDFVPPKPDGQPRERPLITPGAELQGVPAANFRNLLAQTQELVPSTQETLNDMRKSLKRFEDMAPRVEEAIKQYTDLAKSAREFIPELNKTNEQARELAKASRETIPALRQTNDEILVASRNWSRLGERLDVLVRTNEDQIVKALESFNDVLRRITGVLSDENQRNLSTTLKNARAGSENFESISRNTDALVKQSQKTLDRMNQSLNRTDEVLTNLQLSTKPMADRTPSVMKNLDEAADKLNRTSSDLRDLLRAVGQGDGTFRRFVTDPALYNNLNEAACMIVRTMPRLDRILHDLEVFADKIARHPESLGVRGAVSPSSGLKEAPSNGSQLPRH